MNAADTQSHDQNFKTIFVENPWAAITFALPKCAGLFRHEPEIEPMREETIKTIFSDSFARMDVPILAKYENLAFVFLLEHQHDAYSFSIHQLARYVSHLEEQYERDVIPIVYFPNATAKSKVLKRETKSTLFGKRYHYFTYEAVFLRDLPAGKFLNSSNIVARLLLPFMQFKKTEWIKVLDSAVNGVLTMVDVTQGLRRGKYLDFILHYFNLGAPEWQEYRAFKQKQKNEEVVEMISSILKQQGWDEGFREGRTAGEAAGKAAGTEAGKLVAGRDMLLMLLPKRLGPMPAEIESTIRGLNDLERIHAVLARFLEINDWKEVQKLLQ